jgi:hypothetical protein
MVRYGVRKSLSVHQRVRSVRLPSHPQALYSPKRLPKTAQDRPATRTPGHKAVTKRRLATLHRQKHRIWQLIHSPDTADVDANKSAQCLCACASICGDLADSAEAQWSIGDMPRPTETRAQASCPPLQPYGMCTIMQKKARLCQNFLRIMGCVVFRLVTSRM